MTASLPRLVIATVLTAGLAVSAAVGGTSRATADTYTDQIAAKQQQLAADGATMARLRAELASAANQEAALQKAIADLTAQVTATTQQVGAAKDQLASIEQSLAIAQDNLALTQAQLAQDRHQLAIDLVVIYKARNASNYFTNFLNSGDFNSYWQHVLDVNRLGSSARTLVDSVTTDEQTIQADVDQIKAEKAQQVQLVATLDGIEQQQTAALDEREQAQQRLQALQAQDQALLAENEQAAAELNNQIASLKTQEAAALAAGGGNGHFVWPTTGDITQGFGCTSFQFEPYDANCSTKHFHSGIDIASGCGSNLVAGDSGIAHLYYSNYGYGLHIIIVHGNGWTSVYGHMSGFAVGDGQQVHRGQLIGFEGSTGNSTGCHVHFEVDLNGNPMNPLNYLS